MNLLDLRDSASRCVFVSDCPARGFAGESELPLQRNAVDLDHHAVDLIRQRLAFFFPLTDKLPRLVEVVRQSAARVHFETSNFESVQRLPMISEDGAAIRDEHVGKVVQPTLCGNTRLKLPHGAGGRIARIRKQRKPMLFALFVHPFKGPDRHQHFAANFEIRRNSGLL